MSTLIAVLVDGIIYASWLFVIAAGLTHHSKMSGMEFGLRKVAEVLFGCVVGLLVSWLMARVWPLAKSAQADEDA